MIRLPYLLLALALSLAANVFFGWQWAQSGAECQAEQAEATVAANEQLREAEADRNTQLDAVTIETQTETRETVREVQTNASERAETIRRVVVRGDCVRPDGLPSLNAAVRKANRAAGH